jgi:uncharacterized membrane protein
MWSSEHSVEAEVTRDAIWNLWADVPSWPEWNADIASIALDGPFATGSTIAMTPRGQQTVELRIAEARERELFVDEAEVAGTRVRTTHRVEQLDAGRVRVAYRLEAHGPAEAELGPVIASDFDETLAALVARARVTA